MPKFSSLKTVLPWILYSLGLAAYSLWSFALTDPNLVYMSWSPYWQYQQWIWSTVFANPILLTLIYSTCIIVLFLIYGWVWKTAKHQAYNWRQWAIIWLLTISPLLLSNNALSHDVFNYMFNAKMVLVYHANPHEVVALNYPDDLWTRFMHNTHTPAPYGYGWTVFSLIPAILGLGKFTLTWWWFRWLNVFAVFGLIWILSKLHEQLFKTPLSSADLSLVIFNPLFVLEVISNSHNDLWLLVPALMALWLAGKWLLQEKPQWSELFLSIFLLGFSISTKIVTILLVPIWTTLIAWSLDISAKLKTQLNAQLVALNAQTKLNQTWQEAWPLLASSLLFAPLLTDRSQQFHPWYWLWVLVWLPLVKLAWWRQLMIVFSLSSLLRYLPWLLAGGYTDEVLWQQKLITWSLPIAWLLISKGFAILKHNTTRE
jgi:hypothetical protein